MALTIRRRANSITVQKVLWCCTELNRKPAVKLAITHRSTRSEILAQVQTT